jgi:hypothetical protein
MAKTATTTPKKTRKPSTRKGFEEVHAADIVAGLAAFQQATPPRPKGVTTLRALVALPAVSAQIERMTEAGYSMDEVAAALASLGVTTNGQSLAQTIRDVAKRAQGSTSAEAEVDQTEA